MKDLTANQIIKKALRIKDENKFPYKHIFNAMGLKLVDNENSEQGYYSVVCESTGNELVISKDYGNKVRLYQGFSAVVDNDLGINEVIDKVDLHGILTKREHTMKDFQWKGSYTKKGYHKNNKVQEVCFPKTKTMQYKSLQSSVDQCNRFRINAIESYDELERKIVDIRKEQERLVKREKSHEQDRNKKLTEMGKLLNGTATTFK